MSSAFGLCSVCHTTCLHQDINEDIYCPLVAVLSLTLSLAQSTHQANLLFANCPIPKETDPTSSPLAVEYGPDWTPQSGPPRRKRPASISTSLSANKHLATSFFWGGYCQVRYFGQRGSLHWFQLFNKTQVDRFMYVLVGSILLASVLWCRDWCQILPSSYFGRRMDIDLLLCSSCSSTMWEMMDVFVNFCLQW